MDRFRKILVSVDASLSDEVPHSLTRAIRLAKDTGAELRVVDVLNTPSYVHKMFHGKDSADEFVAEELAANLKLLCESHKAQGLNISWAVLRGRPFVEIIQEVERQSCDLVMRDVSSDEESGSLFFGSLDMRLMRNCKCPVWLVQPRPSFHFERVLAAIDPMPESEPEERLNRRIIDLASSLSALDDGQLFVISALEVRGESLLMSKMTAEAYCSHVDELAVAARKKMHASLKNLPSQIDEKHLKFRRGNAAQVVTTFAREIDADLIVMGTLARVGVPGMLIGNTAESVLRQVRSSVLTIKPKAFVSPVATDRGDSYPTNTA